MIFFSFLFLLCLNFINLSDKKSITCINSPDIYPKIDEDNAPDCTNIKLDFDNISHDTIFCIKKLIKVDKTTAYNIFTTFRKTGGFVDMMNHIHSSLNSLNISWFIYYLDDILEKEENDLLYMLIDFIANENTSCCVEIAIDLIENFPINKTFHFLFSGLKKIFILDGFDEIIHYIYERYKNNATSILEYLMINQTYEPLFKEMRGFIEKYTEPLYYLFFNIIQVHKERIGTINVLIDFVLDNFNENSTFLNDTKDIVTNQTLTKLISDTIKLDSPIGDKIFEELVLNVPLMDFTVNFLKNRTNVEKFRKALLNLPNKTYVDTEFSQFIKDMYGEDKELLNFLINVTMTTLKNVILDKSVRAYVVDDILSTSEDIFLKNAVKSSNLSNTCSDFINYTFFSTLTEEIFSFRVFYARKYFVDTTKDKNDFLTYENCLFSNKTTNYSKKYNIKPIFLIGKVKDQKNQNKLKNGIFFEKYSHYIGYCFPHGTVDGTENGTSLCNDDDYKKLIRLFATLNIDVTSATFEPIVLYKESIIVNRNDYIHFYISFIIISIPLIIYIFLIIYAKIKKNSHKGNNENDYQNKINYKGIIDDELSDTSEKNNSIKLYFPKWYLFLNEYFNIIENGRELFVFSINVTKFNNLNGITYIKGILGISSLVYIYGLTFFILSNLPTKIFGVYQFYSTIYNPFYIIAFIGLRYCPRMIFSCSGYTLIYKFLSFIERDPNFYFCKFLILQSYKYILLILVTLFLRYSIYYFNAIFRQIKNPMLKLFELNMTKEGGGYFIHLFSFLFDGLNGITEANTEKSVIYFLYLPLNEVFLFIIGIGLISIGYKFKMRIDIAIISIILIIYLGKLFLFLILKDSLKIYPTLYFYLFGYGEFMLNPLYNMPSFFIGMYFGLVNYTIQRGVNSRSKQSNYIELKLHEFDRLNAKENNDDNNDNNDNNVNNGNKDNNNKKHKFKSLYVKNGFHFNSKKGKSRSNSQKKIISDKDINTRIEFNNEKINNNYFNNTGKPEFSESFDNPLDSKNILFEMPFLKTAIGFTNFHRKNQDKFFFKLLFLFCIILFLFFSTIIYIMIYKYIDININSEEIMKNKKQIDFLSFEDIIPNTFLNIVYILDIEIVVLMINWVCFYLYFKGGQINDFLNNIYWSFFTKSYFSYSLVSSPVILYILYLGDTVVTMSIYNILLYSSISIFLVFLLVIIFYSCYEYPLRKIFKTLKISRTYINIIDEELEDDNDMDDK